MNRTANILCQVGGLRAVLLTLVALVVLLPTGCVRRRLTVRSNPPGALVYVDNQQIGTTPCSVDFTYYGTREIRLVKPGYETLTVNQPIPTPWYQIPPIDFVSENLVPMKIRDNRSATYTLTPQVIVPTQLLLDRANQLRVETAQGVVVPTVAPISPGIVVPPEATVPVPPGTFGPPPSGFPSLAPPTEELPPLVLPPPTTRQTIPESSIVVPSMTIPPTTTIPPTYTPPAFPLIPPPASIEPQRGRPIVSPPLR